MSGLQRRQDRLNADLLNDGRIVSKTASATLNSRELLVDIDSSSVAITITLAPVSEMIGQIVTLYVSAYTETITIAAGDSQDFTAPTFNGADDGAVLYSDGRRWWTLGTRT